jgi:hypothetical protein
MELILLSVFGTVWLFLLELYGLLYERWVRDQHRDPEIHTVAPARQPGRLMAGQFLSCAEAANDADATTIVRARSRRALCDSTGE